MYLDSTSQNRTNFLTKVYLSLGMSIIPTILGALFGMHSEFVSQFLHYHNILSLVLFIGSFFLFSFMIQASGDSPLGIVMLTAFTFVEGVFLSSLLGYYLSTAAGSNIVLLAFIGTCSILFVMSLLSSVIKRDLSFMGKGLVVAGLGFIVLMIVNVFLHVPMISLILAYVGLVLYSVWLLFDIQRISRGGENSVVRATFSVYLDLMNIFLSLLRILGNNN